MRWLRRILLGLVIALVVAQAVRIERSNPPLAGDVAAPPAVAAVLRRACYDCHSNETVWPWYAAVAPVSWLLARDVREGRAELNFSAWDRYDATKRRKRLKESAEEVTEGEMPPWTYVLVHPAARLDPAATALLRTWTATELAQLPAKGSGHE